MSALRTLEDNNRYTTSEKALNRIESVDVFRFIAITAVIAIHTEPFHGSSSGKTILPDLSVLIDQLARFAVPFFFVISGYFWGAKIRNATSPASVSYSMAKRILLIFFVWSIVYALPYNLNMIVQFGLILSIKISCWILISLIKHPVTLIMEGTGLHLWFFIALLCSLGICSFFVSRKHYKTLIAVSVTLYSIGLLAKAYSNTPLGIHLNFDTRDGPFFGTIFFVSGYYLSNFKPNPRWFFKGVALLVFGWILHFSELYLLRSLYRISPYQDYLIGTYFMGIGAAVAALSNNVLLRNKVLSDIGKFSLGIYAIHVIFVSLLRPIDSLTNSPLWEIGYIMLVLLFSAASAIALSKSKVARRIVA